MSFREGRFNADTVVTKDEAAVLLRRDLRHREQAVSELVEIPLNQNEFDALASFTFNVGAGAFARSSVRRRLNRGDRIGAASGFSLWNKARIDGELREVRGLSRRRAAEAALFLEPLSPAQQARLARAS